MESEKKIYDLRIDSHGRIDPMIGIFEKTYKMVYGESAKFPEDEYITIELPLCVYRINKRDFERKDFQDFIAKARKHQEKSMNHE